MRLCKEMKDMISFEADIRITVQIIKVMLGFNKLGYTVPNKIFTYHFILVEL